MFKTIFSLFLGAAGAYYLWVGKKQTDFTKMMIGAALTVASMFIF